jgi:hypothetical protein
VVALAPRSVAVVSVLADREPVGERLVDQGGGVGDAGGDPQTFVLEQQLAVVIRSRFGMLMLTGVLLTVPGEVGEESGR